LQRQEKSRSWLWKGVLLAAVGVVAARAAMKYSQPLAKSRSRAVQWVADKVYHAGQVLREEWRHAVSQASMSTPAGIAAEQLDTVTDRREDMVEQPGTISDMTTGFGGGMRPKRRVSRGLYRKKA